MFLTSFVVVVFCCCFLFLAIIVASIRNIRREQATATAATGDGGIYNLDDGCINSSSSKHKKRGNKRTINRIENNNGKNEVG